VLTPNQKSVLQKNLGLTVDDFEEPEPFILDLISSCISVNNEIDNLSAACVHLRDIININKKVSLEEFRNFFLLIEVYGSEYFLNGF